MGTNYYIVENECECCKRKDLIHIGKSSGGWAFSFRGYKNTYGTIETDDRKDIKYPYDVDLISWENYKQVLKNKKIIDEYHEEIPYDEFVEMIETYKSPSFINERGRQNMDHITYILNDERYTWVHSRYSDVEEHWHDNLGYSFSRTEFS